MTAKALVDSTRFNQFITGLILFASLLIGLETYSPLAERYEAVFHFLNLAVLGIFILEAVLRFVATWPRPTEYFKNGWNIFDLAIITLSIIPISSTYAPVIRLIRLLRVFRLLRTIPELQIILGALVKSIPSMGYVGGLLGLFIYVYAVAGVFLFGQNDPVNFGNLHLSALTLFKTLTGEGWTDFLDVQVYGCSRFELPFPEQCVNSMPSPWVSPIYFVSFILLATMVFLNLLLGVVVGSMDEVRKSHERKHLHTASDEVADRLRAKISEIQELLEALPAKK